MNKYIVTQNRLQELLHYDSETGVFTWKVNKGPMIKAGDTAGYDRYLPQTKTYYRKIQIDNKQYYAHRLAWLYVCGAWPECQIDHIDQNSLNNAIKNLREATRQENLKNSRIGRANTSGILGVAWCRPAQKWRARIHVNYKTIFLGYFANKNDAIIARKMAEYKYGFHPNHGTINLIS